MMVALRIAVGALGAVALALVIRFMNRWSWGTDVIIAVIAVIAFSYYFERDDPPADAA